MKTTEKTMQEIIDAQMVTINCMKDQRTLMSDYLKTLRDELLKNCKAELMINDRNLGRAEVSDFTITWLQKAIDAIN